MSAVLLDTNVLSELIRPKPDPKVAAFVSAQTDPFISVVTLHELTYGAERAPPARRAKLTAWIAGIRAQFAGRILPVTEDIASQSGRLRALAEAQGRPTEAVDTMIAASAISRGAAVATRNISDFTPLGVTLIDPWA
ncbi:MAG: type II toxin-antitoxin system VapC family toxin [Alphaproteobacteria bacterium]|nr:type II toxin-antitoxin system VapC family toxin [Alphaproteobacteria bacterium]